MPPHKKGDNINNDTLGMQHKRFIVTSEPAALTKFDASTIKKLTGSDEVTARPVFGNSRSFFIKGTLAAMCNIMPNIDTFDGGIARRIAVVDFPARFTTQNALLESQAYKSKLRCAFFNVLAKYWHSYKRNQERLVLPPSVIIVSIKSLNKTEGVLAWFKNTFMKVADNQHVVPLSESHTEYKAFCVASNIDRLVKLIFTISLREYPPQSIRQKIGELSSMSMKCFTQKK